MIKKMIILYGANDLYSNQTKVFCGKNIIYIPSGDTSRHMMFNYIDPVYGVIKHIKIIDDYGNIKVYSDSESVYLIKNQEGKFNVTSPLTVNLSDLSPEDKLTYLHHKLKISFGSMTDELPEQKMATRFINPNARVLEIGGNIGRNSCIIGSLLNDSNNLTVLECNKEYGMQLTHNRNQNNLNFKIEASALSKNPLIQKGWDTIPLEGNEIPSGWNLVDIISYETLIEKYGKFDTLVADCEGAFYYILNDYTDLLSGITTIIMENDYHNIDHKQAVDRQLIQNGFNRVYYEAGGWGPCHGFFFEVWTKPRQ